MLISCHQAVEICNKAQYHEADSWQIFKLKLHHLYCRNCKAHASRNGKLTDLCSKASFKCMNEEKKTKIKEEIEEKINSHS